MPEVTVEEALNKADAAARDGDLGEARRIYEIVLKAIPENARARQGMAALDRFATAPDPGKSPPQNVIDGLVGLFNEGKFTEVAETARKLTGEFPEAFVVWNILGVSAAQTAQLDLAEQSFRSVCELNPGFFEAHSNLGNVLKDFGRFEEAEAAYRKALEINPEYVLARNNLGVALYEQDKFEEAIEAFRKALRANPDYTEAHNHLGVALEKNGDIREAMAAYRKALSLRPDYYDAHNNLGNALKEADRPVEALAAYEEALRIRPDHEMALCNMGNALKELGRFDEAIDVYRKALSIKPDYAVALGNLGNALQGVGKLDEATAAYHQAIELVPGLAEVYRHLSTIKTFEEDDPLIFQMERISRDEDTSDEGQSEISFALAKVHEDLGDLDKALKYLRLGNALRKKILRYDISQDQKLFAALENADAEIARVAKTIPLNPASPAPIFILGMPRSGTSLVEQIVSSHSQVAGAGELPHLSLFGAALAMGKIDPTEASLTDFRNKYLGEIADLAGGCAFVSDKMPQNFRFIGLIANVLPEARIIHMRRDPRATCWSGFKSRFGSAGLGYCYDLTDIVDYYLMYEDMMDYWDARYGDRIYHLDYDALTLDPEPAIRDLLDHLNLGWEDACLSPHENKRLVKTKSMHQVRKKIYQGSSQAWRKYEPFLDGVFDTFTART